MNIETTTGHTSNLKLAAVSIIALYPGSMMTVADAMALYQRHNRTHSSNHSHVAVLQLQTSLIKQRLENVLTLIGPTGQMLTINHIEPMMAVADITILCRIYKKNTQSSSSTYSDESYQTAAEECVNDNSISRTDVECDTEGMSVYRPSAPRSPNTTVSF